MITAQQAQDQLDQWWIDVKDPRISKIQARIAKIWNTVDAGYVRASIVDGADGLGTAIRVELEKLDHTLVIKETRPTTVNIYGFTLDDMEYLGATRRSRTIVASGTVEPNALVTG